MNLQILIMPCRTIHFPPNKEELLVSRKRLVFDEFFLFILSVQKDEGEDRRNPELFPGQRNLADRRIS